MSPRPLPLAVLCLVLAGSGCGGAPDSRPPAQKQGEGRPDISVQGGAGANLLPIDSIPVGEEGAAVRRGLALIEHTPDSLPRFARSSLRCTSCHLDRGQRKNAAPLVGAAGRYPKFMDRSGVVASLEDRVNYCFTRSLAGDALPTRGREMRDIVAYLRFISRDIGPGGHVPGEGMPRMTPLVADSARGAAVFLSTCARCHGPGGEGSAAVPALWGARSYSIGASMARVERAASFVRHNMPYDRPGTMSDRDAFDVAAFIDAQARPDSPGKEHDWPKGDAPVDVPYDTRGHRAANPPPVLARAQRSSSSISREDDAGAPPPGVTVSVRR